MTVQNALEEMKERAFAPAFQKYLFDTYKVLAQTDFSEEEKDRYCGDIIMQKSICVDLFAHKRVRNLGQAERFRVRDVHTPLVSKEDWREVKNRVSMPDREAVILEDITGEGVLAELHPIQFKEDIDI